MNVLIAISELVKRNQVSETINAMETIVQDEEYIKSVSIIRHDYEKLRKAKIEGSVENIDFNNQEHSILDRILLLAIHMDENTAKLELEHNIEDYGDLHKVLEKVLDLLDECFDGFKGQIIYRDELRSSISNRLNNKESMNLEYEDFFEKYYSEMNTSEIESHNKIRYYTENVINIYNRKIASILISQPKLKEEIPRLHQLERHLLVWLGKYESVFKSSSKMSLVYTGVKEGIGFPKRVETEIKDYLAQNKSIK